jgi:hypothetical protein
MAEDRLLELLKLETRLDPEFIDEQTSPFPIQVERFRLPGRPVEREHELRTRPLAKGMLMDKHFELPDELTVPTQGEVCLDVQLERPEAKLLETKDLRLHERLTREVGESRPAPEAERIVEQSRSSVGRGPRCLLDELLEAQEVELVGCDPDQISGLSRDDRLARAKRLSQLRDVILERVRGRPGRSRSPEFVDEAIV